MIEREADMSKASHAYDNVVPCSQREKDNQTHRKRGLNQNKEGSVRKINNKVYIDFRYLGERVRECSGESWSDKSAKRARHQLDRIIVAIQTGTFRFAEVFPDSNKRDYFSEKERQKFGYILGPREVFLKDYIMPAWYPTLKKSGHVTGRTLLGYKSYIDNYLVPYFGHMTFADLNKLIFDRFIAWAREQMLKGKIISNRTINKIFVPLKIICKDAAIEYGWSGYNPFFGFKKPKENDSYDKINPLTLPAQQLVVSKMSEHWQPYFRFAFCSGMRHGEMLGLKQGDVDWKKKELNIRRAITQDENGDFVEGSTKNRYSRRTLKLTRTMLEILNEQQKIYDQFKGEYFFCNTVGGMIDFNNLRNRCWKPALSEAGLNYREMKQTRHSFATITLANGVNPLRIAKIMGHRNTDMIINVYSKYVDDGNDDSDVDVLDEIFREMKSNPK
ncbi:tyrosine-type recombinase/integrase [Thermodesulfobacteriota bacterium]